ncbi:hypothetical protein MJO28_007683 [Puccinia striiformis f. sp. tritici]|uniref:Uncharacterized protein n=1 Tax=Puccinia striiformis f. sp. tritici TaxID=168172 RepID=A0ACC0EF49_9BASI|nr:hypothetical protein Pst134EA_013763 [Puccinia striiformis f. sp. tritici]KAH9454673.1 hypothetical protein Pst134EB_014738 [Puccinia striiformis f. sp. tritici]KAH9465907.1 hypothetical protein Pst134EA_013763 [Puccinia striiformis f. sp. tritici]KAI7951999.1 hypothetical protein MJO28_007683 [Puccinia striiformis f. sp. tritici]KAI7956223.1 hypothetical protein MJO29_007622 [Puccinia striiformis f. sp. tritici]
MQSIKWRFLFIILVQVKLSYATFHCDDRAHPEMSKTPICARKPVKSDEVHIPDATNFEYLLINAHKKEDGWTCGGVKIYDRQTTNRFCCNGEDTPTPIVGKESTMDKICYAR